MNFIYDADYIKIIMNISNRYQCDSVTHYSLLRFEYVDFRANKA